MVGCVLAAAQTARADWPMERQNPARTGTAPGTSNIKSPAVYWRHFLGGGLGGADVLVTDTNEDGKNELLYAEAGKVMCRSSNGELLWQTASLSLTALLYAGDFNGDQKADVVATSPDRVFVVQAATGAIQWAEPAGEMGNIGAVRIADFTGDGLVDLFVQECGWCEVSSGKTGFLYSYGGGFTGAQPQWVLPEIAGGGSRSATVIDVDGDGRAELIHGMPGTLSVRDGSTGAVLAQSTALENFAFLSKCVAADIDANVGQELVCIINDLSDGHRLFVMKYVAGSPPSFSRLWGADVGKNGTIFVKPDFVRDLDGDASIEVTVGAEDDAGVPFTTVFDAISGQVLASVSGQAFAGTAAVGASATPFIFTKAEGVLNAWRFSRGKNPALTYLWSLTDRTPIEYFDASRHVRGALNTSLGQLDLDADGEHELLTLRSYGGAEVVAYGGSEFGPVTVGMFVLPQDTEPVLVRPVPPLTRPAEQVLVAQNDGSLKCLDSALAPTPEFGSAAGHPGELRVGGFYSRGDYRSTGLGPVLGRLGENGPDGVLTVDGRRALIRMDASGATVALGPKIVWRRTRAWSPTIVAGLDGSKPGIACLAIAQPETTPPTYTIRALSGDGVGLWGVNLPGAPFNDIVPASGSAGPFLVAQWGFSSDYVVHTRALSAASGALLWDNAPADVGITRAPMGVAVGDWNSDGTDDAVHQHDRTRIVSGVNGLQIASSESNAAYFLPALVDVVGDDAWEVTLHGGYDPARTLSHDLGTTLWQSTDDDRPYPFGAVVACPGGPLRLVEGSWMYPSRLKFTDLGGSPPGTASTVVLAGGKRFGNEAEADQAQAKRGQLTSASGHENLTGDGRPSVVVGSTDGWLYSVNPCDKSLDFSFDFQAPVGAIAFGDTDGDGMDEIVASVADGYLYGLKHAPLPAPAWVWDTDPPHSITTDVDFIETANTLFAAWAPVAGADSYELAVVSQGTYVTTPAWMPVGNVVAAEIPVASLAVNQTYTVSVRALSGANRSPDTPSDGVTVTHPGDGGIDADAASDGSADVLADAPNDLHVETQAEADTSAPADGTPGDETALPMDGATMAGGACACRHVHSERSRGCVFGLAAALAAGAIRRRRSPRARSARNA